jgi:heparin/heparan-sulfate lyase
MADKPVYPYKRIHLNPQRKGRLVLNKKWTLSLIFSLYAAAAFAAPAAPVILQAEAAKPDADRIEILSSAKIKDSQVAALKAGAAERVHEKGSAPDLVFDIKLPAGRYVMRTFAVTDAEGEALMAKAKTKFESMFMQVQVDDDVPSKKVVYVPWNRPLQTTGKFTLKNGSQLKLWLPRGVQLDRIELEPYLPPAVPAAAKNYQPKITPKPERPRLWVNPETLPQVRANLTVGENKPVWEAVQAAAAKPYAYTYDPEADIQYDAKLERAAQEKAFVYLMTGDKKLGREAVDLMMAYIPNVQFSNLLDIAREIGRALVSCSFVYDYCYDLMTPAERQTLSRNLMRLADDMECGWPPFGQTIVNGHGAEAQINRDLLTMSIAIYGENNEPYKYCSYLILEELMPMRAFEYRSNRHNQGVGYGTYRFNFEMHAAWLMRRMAGREVFDPSIKTVYYHWLYGRMPDGSMMLDGDGSYRKGYFKREQTTFMCYSYAADPLFKGEFEKQGGKADDALLFLMLNDPTLKADRDLTRLPLVHYFKDVLPAMIFRTGWNIDPDSSDVFIEMKGGGYGFANHQHVDAGAFQIFYRGVLATDLGTYKFSGTPYDFGFNKRSIPHNLMLVYDPNEKFGRGNPSNDGGQRVVERTPTSVKMLTTDPEFRTGRTLGADFGPDAKTPTYCYFKTDLAPAYSKKVKFYTRTFCALNTGDAANPALLITVDRIESANPEFKKYYLLNSLFEPKKNGDAFEITSDWKKNPGKLTMKMLLPEQPEVQILQGEQTWNVFGKQLTAPLPNEPQAKGFRTMFSPAKAQTDDLFVAVMAIGDAAAAAPAVTWQSRPENIHIAVADFLVVLGTGKNPATRPFQLVVPPNGGKETRVLLADLAVGKWLLRSGGKEIRVMVEPGKHTAYLTLPAGDYQVTLNR